MRMTPESHESNELNASNESRAPDRAVQRRAYPTRPTTNPLTTARTPAPAISVAQAAQYQMEALRQPYRVTLSVAQAQILYAEYASRGIGALHFYLFEAFTRGIHAVRAAYQEAQDRELHMQPTRPNERDERDARLAVAMGLTPNVQAPGQYAQGPLHVRMELQSLLVLHLLLRMSLIMDLDPKQPLMLQVDDLDQQAYILAQALEDAIGPALNMAMIARVAPPRQTQSLATAPTDAQTFPSDGALPTAAFGRERTPLPQPQTPPMPDWSAPPSGHAAQQVQRDAVAAQWEMPVTQNGTYRAPAATPSPWEEAPISSPLDPSALTHGRRMRH